MAGAAGAAILAEGTFLSNAAKVAQVAGAVASLEAQGFTWFGLTCEGGGRRNQTSICNGTKHSIELKKIYIQWGKVKVPPDPYIDSMAKDECLFHNAGSWAPTGSCGIITYELQHNTSLHILWECPFNFDFSDNYIGLMLTSSPSRAMPNEDLCNNMLQTNTKTMGLKPKSGSDYDLVCCGPGDGKSIEAGGDQPWGSYRPCKVQDQNYKVLSIMGDRHATSSKITILNVT